MTMRAVVCEQPGILSLATREVPERGAGQVLLRIRRVGMCGTDYHIFRGTQPYLAYPRVMGHELAGEVVEGGGAGRFTPGQVALMIRAASM